MSETNKPNTVFWILGGLFLLWNAFGCYLYYMDMTLSQAAYIEQHGEAMSTVRDQYPTWSKAAYAIAVWGGLVAAILFLLRKGLAVPLFMVSVAAAVISFIWGLTNADARAAAGSTGFVMPVIVVAIGIFEVWWSKRQKGAGVIN